MEEEPRLGAYRKVAIALLTRLGRWAQTRAPVGLVLSPVESLFSFPGRAAVCPGHGSSLGPAQEAGCFASASGAAEMPQVKRH